MAGLALIVHKGVPGVREERLRRVLEFFGVPCQAIDLETLAGTPRAGAGDREFVILGSIDTVAAARRLPAGGHALRAAAAVYAYAGDDRAASLEALSSVAGVPCRWAATATGTASVAITRECADLAGPMAGVRAGVPLRPGDAIATLATPEAHGGDRWTPLVSTNEGAAFVRSVNDGVTTFICTSAEMPDLDAPVGANYYDVKKDFLSAVPLVMFLTWAFRDVIWRPQELGACLVIDDPLLKSRYGLCDFRALRDAMRQHHFTTSIAFIPWNWARTRRSASEFFRREADLFSVSVHGCDHVSAEFGSTAAREIDRRARLAQARMRKHESRTRIQHDPIMVFPQGVFSSICPAVLKRNGFIAAVNTEISPLDPAGPQTLLRDVWDTATMRYGSFAVYTRRYHHHGLENFAFDLLLGKPCFIVAHHEFFADRGAALAALVDQLNGLNCTLHWRSLGEAVRRACRVREQGDAVEVEMYGTELRVVNASDRTREFHIFRREDDPARITRIQRDGVDVDWTRAAGGMKVGCTLVAGSETLIRIDYQPEPVPAKDSVSFRYEISVALRRLLCEVRDEYLHRLPTHRPNAKAS